MFVYTVLFDWATEDSHDAELFVYTDELLARDKFKTLVHDEKKSSWCGAFFSPRNKFNKKYADQVDYDETNELFHIEMFNTPYYSTIRLTAHFVE
jgi:hypothetical protein